MSDQKPNLDSLFETAAAMESAAERAAFLDKSCKGDLELRKQVELLLQSDEQLSGQACSGARSNDRPGFVWTRACGVIGGGSYRQRESQGAEDRARFIGIFEQICQTMAYAHSRGVNMDERADVFGLGAILCEILTGKPPYVADDGTEVYRMASRGKLGNCFERLAACGADADLMALTKHCLELEPVDRPRNAGVLAERVTEHLESVETKLRETELAKADAQIRAEELGRRNKLALTAGAAIVASLVIGIAASVWQANRAEHEATRAKEAGHRAVAAFDELRATAPAFAEQARSLAAVERFAEALEKLDYALKLRPDSAEFLVAKGDLLQCHFKLAEAAAIYREALLVQPGLARAEESVKLCDELLAAKPNADGKLTRESLAKLHLGMQQQQRPAAELLPVARLLGEEKKLIVEYRLARLKDLPVSAENPLANRLPQTRTHRLP